MSRRTIFSVAGLILLACCAALAVLPARWLITALPASWPVAVVDASGTIWSGSAIIAVGTPARRRTVAEPLHWQLSFANGPRLLVSHRWLGGPLALAPGWMGIRISAQTLQLPAAVLTTLDARIEAISPGGELSLKWPARFIGRAGPPAGARLLDIQWHHAESALTPIRPLGDYVLAVKQGPENGADLVLSTQKGPLMLSGTGVVNGKNGLHFDGKAQVDPAASVDIHAALRDLLATLGPRQDNQTLLRVR